MKNMRWWQGLGWSREVRIDHCKRVSLYRKPFWRYNNSSYKSNLKDLLCSTNVMNTVGLSHMKSAYDIKNLLKLFLC